MEKDKQEIKWHYGGPVSDEVIRSVESHLTIFFPPDYRVFIAEHNGARPRPNAIDIPGRREVVFERFVRLDFGAGENVIAAAAALAKQSAKSLVPFATDPFGNLFCFHIVGRCASEIVFWDHESGNSTTICKTFSELIGLLHSSRL